MASMHRHPRGVLGQTTVARLRLAELLFDDPERVLYFGSHAGLEFLQLLQLVRRTISVKRSTLARSHGHMPAHLAILEFFAFSTL